MYIVQYGTVSLRYPVPGETAWGAGAGQAFPHLAYKKKS